MPHANTAGPPYVRMALAATVSAVLSAAVVIAAGEAWLSQTAAAETNPPASRYLVRTGG